MGMLQMPMRVRAEDCLVFTKGSKAVLVRRYRLASTANGRSFCASACWLPIPLLDKARQCRVGGQSTISRPSEIPMTKLRKCALSHSRTLEEIHVKGISTSASDILDRRKFPFVRGSRRLPHQEK